MTRDDTIESGATQLQGSISPGGTGTLRLMKLFRLALLLLSVTAGSCGDGGWVFFSVNFGSVSGHPDCEAGEFDLLDAQGLTVVVVLTSESTIVLANGSRGSCSDIRDGAEVSVRGTQGSDRITASEVRLF